MTGDAMEAEFDVVARWTREAVDELGADHAIPAACRGSASPSALAWLAEACELAAGSVLLDVGGGVGGPAAWARARYGVRPLLVDPMVGACRAASALFGFPVLAGSGEALPIAAGSADAAWCLGVLCTTPAQRTLLAELHRVVRPGGSLGLLVFVSDDGDPAGAPEGNHFPTRPDLGRLLADAGFEVVQELDLAGSGDLPRSWSDRIDRVESLVRERHGADPRFAAAQDDEDQVGRLIADGRVAGLLVHATATGTPPGRR
ncbi:class I SAM-dependent methyltransferase [Pseudonocardia saturnea]